MSVKIKILLSVIPLIIFALVISGFTAALSARNGLTSLAVEFLGYKAEQLESYAQDQWNLLVNNNLQDREDLVIITKTSIANNVIQFTRSPTELTFALGPQLNRAFANRPLDLSSLNDEDRQVLTVFYEQKNRGWVTFSLGSEERVGYSFFFEPFNWLVLITEASQTFYVPVNQIIFQSGIVLASSIIVSILLLIFLVGVLTRPLGSMVRAMDHIIESGDLSERVEVEYHDEIGKLAHTFNTMMTQLDAAYRQVKQYALGAVLAKRNEQKIRQIFQKYVPNDVINQIFERPEAALIGATKEIAIFFTDIRSFTTISESYTPEALVNVLNNYFSVLVEIIIEHHGIVDKYIGDAVMAFFGAPFSNENDGYEALTAGLKIVQALKTFNDQLAKDGKPLFLTGVGINFGEVTVGNIGTEKKMDYTVIGDSVNLASRLEGLTKEYKQEILISNSLRMKAGPMYPYRLVDTVIVKGKTKGERIFTSALSLSSSTAKAWETHNQATDFFYERKFTEAKELFYQVQSALPGDYLSELYIQRCERFLNDPPPLDWNGTIKMEHK
ncbi:MAG: HAMP domain-containing protein [Spirochaetales bacterium]|nr:HAMP domain-containing protein [Spirochaetales bacterium]